VIELASDEKSDGTGAISDDLCGKISINAFWLCIFLASISASGILRILGDYDEF
jgi:hypothetical protein